MDKPDFAVEVDISRGWFAVEQAYCDAKAAGCQWAEARGWPDSPERLTVYGFLKNPNGDG